MNRFAIIATLASITLASHAQTIDLSTYDALSIEEKGEFFGGMSNMRLQNDADFVKVLALGAADPNDAVRRRAVQRAAMSLMGLQQLAQSGQPAPISPNDLEALSKVLRSRLTEADPETRAAAVRGVVASGSPTNATEGVLLQALEAEQSEELRANLLEAMTAAGYQSDAFKRAVTSRIDKAGGKELEAICTTCSRLRMTEALPALIARIGEEGVPQVILLRSIADFGNAASEAKAKLEQIIADPSSVHQAEARSALAALAADAKAPTVQRPFVDLVGPLSDPKSEPAKAAAGVTSSTTNASPTLPARDKKLKPPAPAETATALEAERPTTLLYVLLALLAVGIVFVVLRKARKL